MSERMPQALPAVTQEIGPDLLVYLPLHATAHLLTGPQVEIYRACDGRPLEQAPDQSELQPVLEALASKGLVMGRRTALQGTAAVLFTSVLMPTPAMASSGCFRATGDFASGGCPLESPPNSCLPCCAAQGGAPACDNNCDDLQCGCFCMQGRRCLNGDCSEGSCLSDSPLGIANCANDGSLLDACGQINGISVCQSDCSIARLNAAEAGVDFYFCCGNCN